MAAERLDCPHCGRSTAVIGKAGQLARHACQISPTMTPAERIRVARDNESRLRRRRTYAIRSAARHRAVANRFHAALIVLIPVAIACLLSAVLQTHLAFGPDDTITGTVPIDPWLIAIIATLGTWRVRLAGDDHHRNYWHEVLPNIGELAIEHEHAWDELVAAEAELPAHIVWPELHPLPLPS